MSQLLRLEGGWNGYDAFCITTSNIVGKTLSKYGNVYAVGECNREHLLRTVRVLIRCARIILRERPDVVISTGAAVGCIACFLGRLSGARVVWVDSITNVEKMSLSGRMVKHISDLCLVQWPELADKYKSVEYVSSII